MNKAENEEIELFLTVLGYQGMENYIKRFKGCL